MKFNTLWRIELNIHHTIEQQLDKIQIAFRAPSNGWLPVELRIGDDRFEFAASSVLNDPVTEIANAGVQLLTGSSSLTTSWWLEPSWHTLSLNTEPNDSEVKITFSYMADENRSNPESEHTVTADIYEFCQTLCQSLRSLRKSVVPQEFASRSGWGKPFPDDKLNLLRRLVKESSPK